MKKFTLTKDDQEFLEQQERSLESILASLDVARQFKLGDYLIAHVNKWNKETQKHEFVLNKNSYDEPVKYQVVYMSASNIPYVKSIDSLGRPNGALYCCVNNSDDYYFDGYDGVRLMLDPAYADALLLGVEYDPVEQLKAKAKLRKEIVKHNKEVKIPSSDINKIAEVLDNAEIGSIFWMSPNKHVQVVEKTKVTKYELNRGFNDNTIKGNCWSFNGTKIKRKGLITVTTLKVSNGRTFKASADYFYGKAVYTARPRAIKELKI